MEGFKIQIRGAEQITDLLTLFPRIVEEEGAKALSRSGFEFETVAKQGAKVDTGRYRASIGHFEPELLDRPNDKAGTQDSHWKPKRGALEVGSNVEYAVHLEKRYGNFANALEVTAPKMERHARTAYEAAIERISRMGGSI
jgi:hypothetical protein